MPELAPLLDPAGVRGAAFAALAATVAALLVMSLVFGSYAFLLRLGHERRQRLWTRLRARWEEPLLAALADPATAPRVHELVEEPYRLHFVRFVLEFARRVRGVERETLKEVVAPYLPPLVGRLLSPEPEARTRAVQTLGELGLPRYATEVEGALDDPSLLVAMVAATALAREGGAERAPAILARLARFETWNRSFLASMLAAMGAEGAPALRRTLADEREEPWARGVAADALRRLSDAAAADVAARALEVEEDPDLIAATLDLLAEVGRPEHIDVVRVRCASPDPTVRARALRALGTLGREEDVPRLLGAISDPSPWVAIGAARGLLAAGGVRLLADLSDSDHPRALLAGQVLMEEGHR